MRALMSLGAWQALATRSLECGTQAIDPLSDEQVITFR